MTRTSETIRRALAGSAVLACALLAAGCDTARTRPIVDDTGQAVPGSVATLEAVTLGGARQWILVRGRSASNPLLLKLHGGPGQAEMATVPFNRALEDDFLVVEWDQRGAGKSRDVPVAEVDMARIVADTVELSELLLRRYGQQRVILVGHSWGSAVGLQAVARAPALYAAFVSTGQMSDFNAATAAGWRAMLDEAGRQPDDGDAAALRALGSPPYTGPDGDTQRGRYVALLERRGHLWHADTGFDRVRWMLRSDEYTWPEKLGFTRAASVSFEALLPDLLALDMATRVPRVQVPVYFAVGRHDLMSPPAVARAYFDRLAAPRKDWTWFERSAHFPQWEEPVAFHTLLRRVRDETR